MIRPYKLTVVTTYWSPYYESWWAMGFGKLWVPGRVRMVGASIIHSPNFPADAQVTATCDNNPPSDLYAGKTLFHITENHVDLPLVPFTEDQYRQSAPPPYPIYPHEGATCFPIIQRDITLVLRVFGYDPPPLGDSVTVTFALEAI